MALTGNTQFEIDLRGKIDALRDELKDQIANGAAVTTWEDYRQRIGALSALSQVEDLIEQVHKELSEKR